MQRTRSIGVALLAMLAFSAVAAAGAQAEEAPFFSVAGTRLKAGEAKAFTAKAVHDFTFATEIGTVSCAKSRLEEEVILGSEAGEPGTGIGFGELSECSVSGNGAGCRVEEPIVPSKIKGELVEGANEKQLLVLFEPAKGKVFATVRFKAGKGSNCIVESTKVTGAAVGEILNEKEEPIESGQQPGSAKSWLLRFPSAQIHKVWVIKDGTGTEVELEPLEALGTEVSLTGTAAGSLVSEAQWSPLP
jgi:hypothetical protein